MICLTLSSFCFLIDLVRDLSNLVDLSNFCFLFADGATARTSFLPTFASWIPDLLDNTHCIFFSKHIQGKTNGNTWTLTSDATDQTWQVIQEERRLTRGWKEFAEAHDLRIGDIVIFKLEGSMVFHVTPFGPSCCDIQYTSMLVVT
ncbi:B3 domain-containing protein REM7-like [Raphanus sativus]|uniref:B3 domain-containing protein REM7-like n=1 Tax=Raphanus sativus TaxID=3726 RepID=A0A9W3BYW5_RAPSA|nr:B3 domain-containing protein REM7-like [Raphanus sativus]